MCGEASVDVGRDGWEALAKRWRSARAFLAGRALFSPLAALGARGVLWPAVACGVIGLAVSTIGALTQPMPENGPPVVAIVVVSLVAGLLMVPVMIAFLAVFFLLFANVCRVLGLIVGVLPLPLGFGRSRANIASALFTWMGDVLLAPIELAPVVAAGPSIEVRGVLTEPVRVHLRRDSWSFVDRFDAAPAGPLRMRADDGETLTVDVEAGSLEFPPTLGTRESVASAAPFAWMVAPGRPGVGRDATFPAGARVVVSGGVRSGPTLAGLPGAPLAITLVG